MHKRLIVLLAILGVGGALASSVAAQEQTFSIDWQNKALSDALATLKKHHGINYILPAQLGTVPVSVNLWNTTAERALQTVVSRAGLQCEKRNSTWFISRREEPKAQGGSEAYAQFGGMPGMGDMAGMGGMPEMGGMGRPNPMSTTGIGQPGPTGGFGTPPGRGTRTTTATTATQQQQRARHFIVIPILRGSPETIGYALEADDVIYDEGGGGGGGGYGSSSGYGGSSGRGGYGSSSGYGSSGSSRGGRSSGSRGGSSRSSGRSSSSRSSGYSSSSGW